MSKIEWTEQTVNPFVGCTPVSEGCENCYAAAFAHRGLCANHKGLTKIVNGRPQWTGEVRVDLDILSRAVKRRKPTVFFVGSMGDIFHDAISAIQIEDMFEIMKTSPQHTFLLLTKRPERLPKLPAHLRTHLPPHIWLGTSVENQSEANLRIPAMLLWWYGQRFISTEPLFGPVHIPCEYLSAVQQVIIGCESGPRARPTRLEWVEQLRDQCVTAGVPVFIKQLRGCRDGSIHPMRLGPTLSWEPSEDGSGKIIKMPRLDGRIWDEKAWRER